MSPITFRIQVCTASISLAASLVIIMMITLSSKKISTPYRRIIFGMSVADVVQSFALVTGPFAIPVGTNRAAWASGTTGTCEANGFFMVLGSTAVPMYLFALSMHYVFKLNQKMSDSQFTKKVERWLHLIINAFLFSMCFAGLVLKTLNPTPTGSFCYFEEYPPLCKKYPEEVGECTRGNKSTLFTWTMFLVICFSLIGIIINMSLLIIRSFSIERMYRSRAGDAENLADYGRAEKCLSCCPCYNYDQLPHESDADYVLRLYKSETIIQSSLYVGAFFLSYLWPLLQTFGSMFGYKFPSGFKETISFFYPLGGLFNILVYTRPKVVRFRHAYPDCSRLKALILVIKAGGEVPDIGLHPSTLLRISCCGCKKKSSLDKDDSMSEFDASLPTSDRILQLRLLASLTE